MGHHILNVMRSPLVALTICFSDNVTTIPSRARQFIQWSYRASRTRVLYRLATVVTASVTMITPRLASVGISGT